MKNKKKTRAVTGTNTLKQSRLIKTTAGFIYPSGVLGFYFFIDWIELTFYGELWEHLAPWPSFSDLRDIHKHVALI